MHPTIVSRLGGAGVIVSVFLAEPLIESTMQKGCVGSVIWPRATNKTKSDDIVCTYGKL